MANKARDADHLLTIDGTPVVYFIGWRGVDVKIGYSSHLAMRLTELIKRTGCPQQILAATPGGRDLERDYHKRFAEHRKHGEWFHWCPSIEAEIDRLTVTDHTLPALPTRRMSSHG